MEKVEFVKDGWRHADDGVTVVDYPAGVYEVTGVAGLGTCSAQCADDAVANGYAVPFGEKDAKGDSDQNGSPNGTGKQPSLSPAGRPQGKLSLKR